MEDEGTVSAALKVCRRGHPEPHHHAQGVTMPPFTHSRFERFSSGVVFLLALIVVIAGCLNLEAMMDDDTAQQIFDLVRVRKTPG
jgi:hypothetical protein